jgi:hypothetical protein
MATTKGQLMTSPLSLSRDHKGWIILLHNSVVDTTYLREMITKGLKPSQGTIEANNVVTGAALPLVAKLSK